MNLLAEASVAPSLPMWATWTVGLVSLLFGGGGVAAILKVRADRKQGIASHELAEDEAITRRWQALVDAQVRALIEPLQKELAAVKEEFRATKAEMSSDRERLEAELSTARTRYWRAISYIRSLNLWISRHMPPGTEPPPSIPAEITEDV